jgi:hypothetical protein
MPPYLFVCFFKYLVKENLTYHKSRRSNYVLLCILMRRINSMFIQSLIWLWFSIFFLLLALWSIRHSWNALLHFSFFILVCRTPWTGDQPVAMPLATQDNTNTEYNQTDMPSVGFEPIIPVFERAKTLHALDRAATVIGLIVINDLKWRLVIVLINLIRLEIQTCVWRSVRSETTRHKRFKDCLGKSHA